MCWTCGAPWASIEDGRLTGGQGGAGRDQVVESVVTQRVGQGTAQQAGGHVHEASVGVERGGLERVQAQGRALGHSQEVVGAARQAAVDVELADAGARAPAGDPGPEEAEAVVQLVGEGLAAALDGLGRLPDVLLLLLVL